MIVCRRVMGTCITVLLFLVMVQSASADDSIFLRYFESAYTLLDDSGQFYSFFSSQNDLVTIVVYGINPDAPVQPAITIFSPYGDTLVEDLNPNRDEVAVVQFHVPESGIYMAYVTRISETPGAVRVMLVEGDAISEDLTLLDELSPVEADRAYLIAGNSDNPIGLQTEIVQTDPEQPYYYFASRGDELTPAPIIERRTPVESAVWQNDQGEIYYTLNIAPNPEPFFTPPPHAESLLASQTSSLVIGDFDFLVQIGDGSDPVRVNRSICVQTTTLRRTISRIAPHAAAFDVNQLAPNTLIEITGIDPTGQWVQIVDSSRPSGQSWIRREDSFNLSSSGCGGKVNEVELSWEEIETLYRKTIRDLEEEVYSFDCNKRGSFAEIYEQLRAVFGDMLPILDLIEDIIGEMECGESMVDVSVGFPSTGDPTISITPPNTPDDYTPPVFGPCNPENQVSLTSSDDFNGTDNCDVVTGNSNGNLILGGLNNDRLFGYGGNDTMDGGEGNDLIYGDDGNDILAGGDGDDGIAGGIGADTLTITSGNDQMSGGIGDDTFYIMGGDAQTLIAGDEGNDAFYFTGTTGSMRINGSDGNDTFYVNGNPGASSLISDGGANRYVFQSGATGNVVIEGTAQDILDFSVFGTAITFNMGWG